jgi:hypothetical protein
MLSKRRPRPTPSILSLSVLVHEIGKKGEWASYQSVLSRPLIELAPEKEFDVACYLVPTLSVESRDSQFAPTSYLTTSSQKVVEVQVVSYKYVLQFSLTVQTAVYIEKKKTKHPNNNLSPLPTLSIEKQEAPSPTSRVGLVVEIGALIGSFLDS